MSGFNNFDNVVGINTKTALRVHKKLRKLGKSIGLEIGVSLGVVHKFSSSFIAVFGCYLGNLLPHSTTASSLKIFDIRTSGKSYLCLPFLDQQRNSHYYTTCKYESLFQNYNHGQTFFNQSQTWIISNKIWPFIMICFL